MDPQWPLVGGSAGLQPRTGLVAESSRGLVLRFQSLESESKTATDLGQTLCGLLSLCDMGLRAVGWEWGWEERRRRRNRQDHITVGVTVTEDPSGHRLGWA